PWAWNASAKPGPKELRTSAAMKAYTACTTCLRAYFGTYLGDTSEDALSFESDHCCSGKHSEDTAQYSLQDDTFFPGPPLTQMEKPKPQPKPRVVTRPSYEQSHLRPRIVAWLSDASTSGLIPPGYPLMFVLPDPSIAALVRAPYTSVCSAEDLTCTLKKTKAWRDRYADSLMEVLCKFELEAKVESTSWAAAEKETVAKRKQDQHEEEWTARKRTRVQLSGKLALVV
ncbi:hypothetical protein OF83DRAFT_1176740, partial [Amylostereum chailletii]